MFDRSDIPPAPTSQEPSEEEVRSILSFESGRLRDRSESEYPEEDTQEQRPPKNPNVVWQSVPSVPDQIERQPQTVKTGPRIDAVFNLSKPGELSEFNRLQSMATDQVEGQRLIFHSIIKEFHQGEFFALVTYSHLYFQKLH